MVVSPGPLTHCASASFSRPPPRPRQSIIYRKNKEKSDRNKSFSKTPFSSEKERRPKTKISGARSASFPSTDTLLATGPLGHCANYQGSSYTKNECNLLIRNQMLNTFLIDNLYEKCSIFRLNREKQFLRGRIWQFCRKKRRLAPKINITFLITNELLNILLFSSFFKILNAFI